MKCPRCGSENRDDTKFCINCGEALTEDAVRGVRVNRGKEKKSLSKIISAFVRAMLYVGILFGCQSCVISEYSAYIAAQKGFALDDYDTMMDSIRQAMEYVYDNYVLVLLIANLLTILTACLFMRARKKSPAEWLGVHMISPTRLFVCALFGAAMQFVVTVTIGLLPIPEGLLDSFDSQYDPMFAGDSLLFEIFAVGIVAGITEELIFRGAIMSRLKPAVGGAAAVIISAGVFGVAHGTPIAIAYAFLLGLLLAALYNRYNSVLPGMVFHIFYNTAAYFFPENETTVMIFYVISIIVAVLCFVKMFVLFPNVFDALYDGGNVIEPGNEKEAYVLGRFRAIRNRTEPFTPEKFEELSKLWNSADEDGEDNGEDNEENEEGGADSDNDKDDGAPSENDENNDDGDDADGR